MFFEKMMNAYWSKKAGNKKGFTLIEMMVVVAIIAALVAVVMPVIQNSRTKAAAATNAANLRATKATFATMQQMNPDDMADFTRGLAGLKGEVAQNEMFNVNKQTDLTVPAPDAEPMTDDPVVIGEETHMKVQYLSEGMGDIYVTYNELPIAYFAEVAEFGHADPNKYYRAGSVGAEYFQTMLTDRFDTTLTAVRENMYDFAYDILKSQGMKDWQIKLALGAGSLVGGGSLEKTAVGTTLEQLEDLVDHADQKGDCMKCAINNVQADGLLASQMESVVKSQFSSYDKNGTKRCEGYSPISSTNQGCLNCSSSHGADAHFSAENGIVSSTTANMGVCPSGGGVHTYDKEKTTAAERHTCTKCGQKNSATKCPTSNGTMSTFMKGSCDICGYCKCCANGTYKIFETYQADAGICIGKDGNGGCLHTKAEHKGYN